MLYALDMSGTEPFLEGCGVASDTTLKLWVDFKCRERDAESKIDLCSRT